MLEIGGDGGSPGSQSPDGNDSYFDGASVGPNFQLTDQRWWRRWRNLLWSKWFWTFRWMWWRIWWGDPSPANGQATQPGTHSPTPAYPSVTDYGFPGGFSVPAGGYATAGGGGASANGGNSPGNLAGGGTLVVLDNQSQDFHIHSLECLH